MTLNDLVFMLKLRPSAAEGCKNWMTFNLGKSIERFFF